MNWPNRLTLLRLILVPVVMTLVLVSYYAEMNGGANNSGFQWYIGSQTGEGYRLPILMLVGGIIFVIASLTDFLDGWLARRNNQVTTFGKFFDPIADKLLVNSVLILFAVTKMLPVWMVVVLILRDIFVDFIRMTLSRKGVTLSAGIYGKLKTAFQMLGLTILFFVTYLYFGSGTTLGNEYKYMNQIVMIPMYAATFFSIFSGAKYFKDGFKDLFKVN